MRIVHVISTGGLYGAEQVLLELGAYQRNAGHEVSVLALDGAGADALVDAARGRGLGGVRLATRTGDPVKVGRALGAEVHRIAPDILHSHGYKPDILIAALRLTRTVACVATCHNAYTAGFKIGAYEWLDRRCFRRFHGVIAVSRKIEAEILAAGVRPGRLRVIWNGIDAPASQAHGRSEVRSALGVRPDEVLMLRVGRLEPVKGNDYLIEAVALLGAEFPLRLLFVGDGPGRSALEAAIRSAGLEDRARILGFRTDVLDLLGAADLFVSSSLSEGLPITVLEAMASRCPIVSTAVGEIPHVLADGTEALFAPPANVEALRVALATALADPTASRQRAAAAFAKYLANHSRQAMGRQYDLAYQDAIRVKARS
jgi:glycosyltransferase involved in cell wall biosynthesis